MTPELLLAIIGVFVAVAAFAGTATSWALERNLPEKRRLQSLGDAQRSGIVMDGSRLTAELPDPTLARLSRLLPRSAKDMSRLQRQLTRAGYPSFSAVMWYSVAEILLPAIMFLAVVTVLGVRSGLLPAAFLAILGYIAPSFYIGHRVKQRQKAIRNGLPDALDLLTVCVEAGSALDQAIARTTEDLHIPHPELADELRKITTEVRAGIPRSQALKNFATRTGVDDVRTLVSMLSQTDRFGTSVGEVWVAKENSISPNVQSDAGFP